MKTHHSLSDTAFLSQLESGTLDPGLFTHEAHIRLAWSLIRENGIETAITEVCRLISGYTKLLGAGDKYNVTLTIAATRAVWHFMQKQDADHFSDFIRNHPRLLTSFKELMASHYSFDIYHSPAAKSVYAEPDLLPFS